jgi:hypothetical protein
MTDWDYYLCCHGPRRFVLPERFLSRTKHKYGRIINAFMFLRT